MRAILPEHGLETEDQRASSGLPPRETYPRLMPSRPPTKRPPELSSLSASEVAELSRRYWETDEPRKDLETASGLTSFDFGRAIGARPAGQLCPNCAAPMVWKSRQGRNAGDATCPRCRHHAVGHCSCAGCRAAAEERHRQMEEQAQEDRVAALQRWLGTSGSEAYVVKALKELTPAQRAFLTAIRQHWDSDADWEQIAHSAGVHRRWIEPYLNRLRTVALLFYDGRSWSLHPVLLEDQVPLP